jgi:hypothetical protein
MPFGQAVRVFTLKEAAFFSIERGNFYIALSIWPSQYDKCHPNSGRMEFMQFTISG